MYSSKSITLEIWMENLACTGCLENIARFEELENSIYSEYDSYYHDKRSKVVLHFNTVSSDSLSSLLEGRLLKSIQRKVRGNIFRKRYRKKIERLRICL